MKKPRMVQVVRPQSLSSAANTDLQREELNGVARETERSSEQTQLDSVTVTVPSIL